MIVYDLYIIKSGRCYITKKNKEKIFITEDLCGAKIFDNYEKALSYMKNYKDLEFKIIKLVEEAGLEC